MPLSNGYTLLEKCDNIALSKGNEYRDNCGVIDQQSNGSVLADNCTSLADWSNGSLGDGTVTTIVYQNNKVFKLDSGSIGSANRGDIEQDVGTFGDRVVTTIKVHHTYLGAVNDVDSFNFIIAKAGVALNVTMASDGLFVSDGATQNEVGTNLVLLDTDQVWTFDCDFTTPSSS